MLSFNNKQHSEAICSKEANKFPLLEPTIKLHLYKILIWVLINSLREHSHQNLYKMF